MNRRETRECAFSLLFQIDFWPPDEIERQIELYFEECPQKLDESNISFIREEVLGAYNSKQNIDDKIDNHLRAWNLNRISKVDLAILRLALYEILYNTEIPVGVSVNEAVELAKKYSSDESPSFINGILIKIID